MSTATALKSRHLLGIADLEPDQIELILETAVAMDVEFTFRREADESEPFAGPAFQLARVVGDEQRRLAAFLQTGDRQQHLVLSAPPGARGIDVHGADRHPSVNAYPAVRAS